MDFTPEQKHLPEDMTFTEQSYLMVSHPVKVLFCSCECKGKGTIKDARPLRLEISF